jgi:hypothetical protein
MQTYLGTEGVDFLIGGVENATLSKLSAPGELRGDPGILFAVRDTSIHAAAGSAVLAVG